MSPQGTRDHAFSIPRTTRSSQSGMASGSNAHMRGRPGCTSLSAAVLFVILVTIPSEHHLLPSFQYQVSSRSHEFCGCPAHIVPRLRVDIACSSWGEQAEIGDENEQKTESLLRPVVRRLLKSSHFPSEYRATCPVVRRSFGVSLHTYRYIDCEHALTSTAAEKERGHATL
jgi:hypothetical protein